MKRRRKKLGLAFIHELNKVTSPSLSFKKRDLKEDDWDDILLPRESPQALMAEISAWRLVVFVGMGLIVFLWLFLRLFQLQIVSGNYNRQLADSNRVQMKIMHAPRGVIYDRNGKILAQNTPGFRLKGSFIGRDEALELEAQNDPRFSELEIDAIRYYPQGEETAHILGYVGEISEEELNSFTENKEKGLSQYRMGDRIGRAGIEKVYEDILRGTDGAEIIEVDAQGKKLRTLRTIDPIPGNNLHLSVDADLQKAAFEALKKGALKAKSCCGTAIAQDSQSGEILTLVSFPSFDGNAFTDPKRNEEVADYFSNKEAPLLNRGIAGTYPPGSTFKITSALAGLSSGKIKKNTKIEDTGVVSIGPYKYANWYFTQHGRTEGLVDVVKALQRSNDIFFYRVGEYVEEKELGRVAGLLGFGQKLGIDLPGEEEGLIPTDEWKKENIGDRWYPGDTLHMAIGQGFLLTTPLQVLAQTAFVASDGILNTPHLATRTTSPNGYNLKEFYFEPKAQRIFKRDDLETIKLGLEAVPKEGGTARTFVNFSIPTAGKTGTAEFGDPKERTHAWYTSYAPVDHPTIVLTVLVEAGGEGSSIAAPIAKEIYTWYFNEDKTNIKSLDLYPSTDSAKTLGE